VSKYKKDDLIKFAGYDVRLYERDKRIVNTVIIYTADVKKADTNLNIGSLSYNPNKVMMCDYDGDSIYKEINAKIKAGQELQDIDMLNLIFLPLMKNTVPRGELAVNTVKLAQTIPDTTKRNACVAAAFAFGSKYLKEKEIIKLLEVLKMTDLFTAFIEEAVEEATAKATAKAAAETVANRNIEIAKKLLKGGLAVTDIAEYTELDKSTVIRLQAELSY
jgi:predicted transposase YdaD